MLANVNRPRHKKRNSKIIMLNKEGAVRRQDFFQKLEVLKGCNVCKIAALKKSREAMQLPYALLVYW